MHQGEQQQKKWRQEQDEEQRSTVSVNVGVDHFRADVDAQLPDREHAKTVP
jgi:hypothetical protein